MSPDEIVSTLNAPVAMWIGGNKTYPRHKIGLSSLDNSMCFITDSHDNPYKISHWKQCIMGSTGHLLLLLTVETMPCD